MTKDIPSARLSKVLEAPLPLAVPDLPSALEELRISVERFCLLAGVEVLGEMLAEDTESFCGPRHARSAERRGHSWGATTNELAYQPPASGYSHHAARFSSWCDPGTRPMAA